MWKILGAATILALGGGAAQAQVADEDYARYFDFITTSGTWICDTYMPLDWVESGELQTRLELTFQKSYSQPYGFTGSAKETINFDNHDYVGTYTFNGFGFNDSSFGTGVSITDTTQTGGDPGWTWHKNANIQLHLEQNADGTWNLRGYQLRDDGQVDYDCGGGE